MKYKDLVKRAAKEPSGNFQYYVNNRLYSMPRASITDNKLSRAEANKAIMARWLGKSRPFDPGTPDMASLFYAARDPDYPGTPRFNLNRASKHAL